MWKIQRTPQTTRISEVRFKVNLQTLLYVYILETNIWKEIFKKFLYTVAPKHIKSLERMKKLHCKYKILLKEIKDNPKQQRNTM